MPNPGEMPRHEEPIKADEPLGAGLQEHIDRLNRRDERKNDPLRLQRAIAYAAEAHSYHARKESKAFIRRDGATPYWIHTAECATRLAQDFDLPEEMRNDCAEAMVYHDMLEDTSMDLPPDVSPKVRELVEKMTFKDGEEEFNEVWFRGPEILVMKLYDKVSGLKNGPWDWEGNPARREYYANYTSLLADAVSQQYGNIRIVREAQGDLSHGA